MVQWKCVEELTYLLNLWLLYPTINVDVNTRFHLACRTGNLHVAQRLYRNQPTLDISALNDHAFRIACWKGHLEMAQWLYQINPTLDISAQNKGFQDACQYGHLPVAQWLYQIQPHLDEEHAFQYACCNGHLHVAQWLYQLNPTMDISIMNDTIFRYTCCYDHLHVAQWLQSLLPDRYSLTIIDNKITNYLILQSLNYFEDTVQLKEGEDTLCLICTEHEVEVKTHCKHLL